MAINVEQKRLYALHRLHNGIEKSFSLIRWMPSQRLFYFIVLFSSPSINRLIHTHALSPALSLSVYIFNWSLSLFLFHHFVCEIVSYLHVSNVYVLLLVYTILIYTRFVCFSLALSLFLLVLFVCSVGWDHFNHCGDMCEWMCLYLLIE